MFQYGHTYRSPFNGPRWGAVIAMFVILAGQMLTVFHTPVQAAPHVAFHVCCKEAMETSPDSCTDPHAVRETPEQCSASGHTADTAHENGCCEDGCADECRYCCHHTPMNSPFPSFHVFGVPPALPLAGQFRSAFHSSDITPPFHPPRN